MVDIIYTAKRKLVSALDEVVTIIQSVQSFERSPEVKKTSAMTIGGRTQSTLHYYTDTYQITTMPIESADQPLFDEFIYSTINGEEFTIDNPDEGLTDVLVQRIGEHSRTRVTTGQLNFFTYSFTVREVI